MLTKKCAASLIVFIVSLPLIYAAVHFMSLFTLSKWVGVSTGASVLGASLILFLIFRNKWRPLAYCIMVIASLATGITISSLFMYRGPYPKIWQSAVLYVFFVVLFYLYCLGTKSSFARCHCRISLMLYALSLLFCALVWLILTMSPISVLANMSLIPFTALLLSMSLNADDENDHIHNLTFCSFGFLFIAVIVVALVLALQEGGDLSGLDAGGDGGTTGKFKPQNPYDYLYKDTQFTDPQSLPPQWISVENYNKYTRLKK